MPIQDIVRWLRDEHNGLHERVDRLREKLAKPPRGDRRVWVEELQACYDEFAASVRQRMAHEEEAGYLKPVVQARPSLAAQVELLKHEHDELARIIASVGCAVHELSPEDNLLLRDCGKRIESLLSWLERHEEHENHMVLYVFSQETGEQS